MCAHDFFFGNGRVLLNRFLRGIRGSPVVPGRLAYARTVFQATVCTWDVSSRARDRPGGVKEGAQLRGCTVSLWPSSGVRGRLGHRRRPRPLARVLSRLLWALAIRPASAVVSGCGC